MVGVTTITSAAGMRPVPSARRTSRWEITAFRATANCWRIWLCWSEGKKSRMRSSVCTASMVCRVLNTMCPVSAADTAARTVSVSRISPIRITSGSWRSR